jgi:hypothetical protein
MVGTTVPESIDGVTSRGEVLKDLCSHVGRTGRFPGGNIWRQLRGFVLVEL